MTVLEVHGLCKQFGETCAVAHLGFSLKAGESLALLGPNGAGKTTTLRMLATLLKPDGGEFRVCGQSWTDPYKIRPLIGFMPDVLGIYPEMTVREYLLFFARAYALPEADIPGRIQAMVDFAGLRPWLGQRLEGMSRGQLQRVALARALLHDPQLLLLDEPAAGLDPRSRVDFRRLLQELRERGKSIVISSHVLSDLEDTSSHIAVIERGALLCFEPMEQFMAQSETHRTMRVQLSGRSAEAQAWLSGRPEVRNPRLQGEDIVFELDPALRGHLLRQMIALELPVEEFSEVARSLEQAYLARTRDLVPQR